VTPQVALTEARNTGASVTVVLDNGRNLTGTVRAVPGNGVYLYVQAPGTAWRSGQFHPDDVVKVIFE
jgi:hypothetical protein